jgi:uncharacterized membrane protein HdeD (DUF308 family)
MKEVPAMATLSLLEAASSTWWILALRGVAAILFAIGAFLWPGLTLSVLVILFGAFALVDGTIAVISGIQARWWAPAIFGLLGILAGGYALFQPGMTALALLFVIAMWAIVRGIFEIAAAITLRKELSNEWLLVLSGIVSIAFGLFIAVFPGAGALSVVWLIGLQALIVGALLLALSMRLRNLGQAVRAA